MRFRLLCALLLLGAPVWARHADSASCGTTQETTRQTLFLHHQATRARAALRPQTASPTPAPDYDLGNIAVVQDRDGVVLRQNQFNLDSNTIAFMPSAASAARYRYAVSPQGYDAAAAASGIPLAALDDDDSRQVALPFSFPFYGAAYAAVYVNSDGNLTFAAPDSASTLRSLGRMTAGPPRIAPLFDDLDPSKTAGGVRVLSESTRVVVSWVAVPEYSAIGAGVPETFQARLYPDGRIEFSYNGINTAIATAVVGISPGGLKGSTTLVDFRSDPSADYSSTVAEVFSSSLQIDIVTVAQRFYQTHDDDYDYLVVYNNLGIAAAGEGTIAFENTVRSSGTGYGVAPQDTGAQYGSAARLHAILQMGMLSQYPSDPTALVPARAAQGDTPLTVLAHETGHLFLAFVSVPDPLLSTGLPMLGYELAHWSFLYDSEASVMEGERIADHGPSVSARFQTTDIVQGFSPLDQYLMGFRPPSGVPDTFFVDHPNPAYPAALHPLRGVSFDGTKVGVPVSDLIKAAGRRTPDSSVAQRHFRFAFVLVASTGVQPSAADLQQIEAYRQQFETFFAQASSNNAAADTTLKRSLSLSIAPAAGVIAGTSFTGAISVTTAPSADLAVTLSAPGGDVAAPPSVTIPAGSRSAPFAITGLKAGVEDLAATPSDSGYETAYARVQVADASILQLTPVSTTPLAPIAVQLTDANHLVYAGARISAAASTGGLVMPAVAITDARGVASFQWAPGSAPVNQLHLAVEASPSVGLDLQAGSAVPAITAVVNAASWQPGLAPGTMETIFGANLAAGQTATAPYPWPASLGGVNVFVDGAPAQVLYISDSQINFLAPSTAPAGSQTVTVTVETPAGAKPSYGVGATSYLPGIFAVSSPVHPGDTVQILCTGLGPTQGPATSAGDTNPTTTVPIVFIGSTPVKPAFSGLVPGYVGLYLVNAQAPANLAPGAYPVVLSVALAHSNAVSLTVQ